MSKRGLNIYRRKDGIYEGRYADEYGKNGNTKYCSIYGKTYTEVKDKLLQIKARIITPEVESGLTVKELFGLPSSHRLSLQPMQTTHLRLKSTLSLLSAA